MFYQVRIYKLCNDYDSTIYIGSTKQTLSQRLKNHKRYSKTSTKYPVHNYILNNDGWNQWKIVLIKLVLVKSREEQLKEEQNEIDKLKHDNNYILLNHRNAIGRDQIKKNKSNKK